MTKNIDPLTLNDVPGLGSIGIKKLNDVGIFSKTDIVVHKWTRIAAETGMTKDDAEEAVQFCRKALQKMDSDKHWPTQMSAWELLQRRKKLKRWTTGSKAVDDLIGGLEARAITEFSGKFAAGKTQISHSLCVTIASITPEKGERPNGVLMFDTEGTCRPERLQEILLARDKKADVEKVLSLITVIRPRDAAHQVYLLENCLQIIEDLNIKAIVIDSGTALFRQGLAEYGEQGFKYRLLNQYVGMLGNVGETYDIPIIVMNQVYASTNPFDPGQKIYGGNVWGHAMTYRVSLKKKGKLWVATTLDFPHKAVEDALFDITSAGVVDVKKKEKKKE